MKLSSYSINKKNRHAHSLSLVGKGQMITPWDDSFISWTLPIFLSPFYFAGFTLLLSLLHLTFTHSFFFACPSSINNKKKKSMSEVWFSDSSKLSSLLLYFSYFVFFYPYLFKLISFLSPLFITTSLLLLLTFLFTPHFNLNFVFLAYQSYERAKDQLSHPFLEEEEEFEAFRVIFGADDLYDHIALNSLPQDEEKRVVEVDLYDHIALNSLPQDEEERVVEVVTEDTTYVKPALENEDKMKLELESFTKELGQLVVGKVVQDTKEDANLRKSPPPISKVKAISQRFEAKLENGGRGGGGFSPSPRTLSNLGSCGSIRRDKEWKRTLACKLFEERHNNSTQDRKGEGMDLLWETYDAESTKHNRGSSKKSTCRPNVKEEEQDEEEDMGGEQLCCLQALKFSGGKMNLGMKKPSLVKISKAIKGIRWLHHLTATTTSTKGKKGRI
ncbi:uncharacterized protein LOC124913641 [Impatiens glandulifera]|uniref:uncharacterized protein LOC124913641 n=1 Tax=Impatiens glandulifera TaxID=253017 RepID=UPI001FB10C61|nr:uncharacterized protein LOC124913641 [Impatiens glandulifera]